MFVRRLIEKLPFFETFNPSPSATVIEPFKGPWTNSANWGNTYAGPIPVAEGSEQSIFETADIPGAPAVHVVNLFRSDAVFTGSTNSQVRARITYGIGARQNTFDCDWTQGAQFALVANYVRVNFVTYAPNADAAYVGGGKPIVLGAGIARGNASKSHALSYTYPQLTITNAAAPADRYIVEVPDFAQALVLHARDLAGAAPAAGAITVQFRATSSQIIAQWDGLRMQDFAGEGLRIPGGTVEVRILNTTAAPPPDTGFRVTPQFILGL